MHWKKLSHPKVRLSKALLGNKLIINWSKKFANWGHWKIMLWECIFVCIIWNVGFTAKVSYFWIFQTYKRALSIQMDLCRKEMIHLRTWLIPALVSTYHPGGTFRVLLGKSHQRRFSEDFLKTFYPLPRHKTQKVRTLSKEKFSNRNRNKPYWEAYQSAQTKTQ